MKAQLPVRLYDFNSRAHVERDGLDWFKNAVMENILTHALTWSATSWQVSIKSRKLNFNSRAHVERDFAIINNFG